AGRVARRVGRGGPELARACEPIRARDDRVRDSAVTHLRVVVGDRARDDAGVDDLDTVGPGRVGRGDLDADVAARLDDLSRGRAAELYARPTDRDHDGVDPDVPQIGRAHG